MGTAAKFEGMVLDGRVTEAENWLVDHEHEFTPEQIQTMRSAAGIFLWQLRFKAEAKTHKDSVHQKARDTFNALFKGGR